MEKIIEGEKINYYITVENFLRLTILEENYSTEVVISEIENFLTDDFTPNYKLTVDISNKFIRSLIMYLIRCHYFDSPAIKGIPLNRIFFLSRLTDNKMTAQLMNAEYLIGKEDEYEIVREVLSYCNNDWKVFEKEITSTFPVRLLFFDPHLMHYSNSNHFLRDEIAVEVNDNQSKWSETVTMELLKLHDKGIVVTKYINEFSLYKIAKHFFDDAIYQYRAEWLGLQSLDIYIPSLSVGIEYQGEQHYKHIEYFGDEEAFEYRQDLDKRKKQLCMENNVNLIEWPFSKPVSTREFLKLNLL